MQLKHLAAALLSSLLIMAAPIVSAAADEGIAVSEQTSNESVSETADDESGSEGEAEQKLAADFKVKLKSSYTYTGSTVLPATQDSDFSVKYGDTVLKRNKDYTVQYLNNIKVGYKTAKLRLKGIGEYSGQVDIPFTIKPKRLNINLLTSKNDGFTVGWINDPNALGFQVKYSTDPNFAKNVHSHTVIGKDQATLNSVPTVGEVWYVKVRAFISSDGTVNGTRYGDYSDVRKIKILDGIKSVTIPYISYTYSGKKITPAVKVKGYSGRSYSADSYTVKYTDNVNVGKAGITVTGKSPLSGSYSRYFFVKPKRNKITSIVSVNDGIKLTWERDNTALGYQVLYSTDKNFEKNVHSTTITKLSKTSVGLINVPKKGETWYVKVRSFITKTGVIGSTRYGNYSPAKKITVLYDPDLQYLLSAKDIFKKACELLGSPYNTTYPTNKGTNVVHKDYPLLPTAQARIKGVDCSGLVYWTLRNLGVSITSPQSVAEPGNYYTEDMGMPCLTYEWFSDTRMVPFTDLTMKVNGYPSKGGKLKLIRDQLTNSRTDYYHDDYGNMIPPGSIVLWNNPTGINHMWFYIGYAEGGKEGIKKLLKEKYGITGIQDSAIYYDKNDVDYWKIESAGHGKGCILSNGVLECPARAGTCVWRITADAPEVIK